MNSEIGLRASDPAWVWRKLPALQAGMFRSYERNRKLK